MSFFSLYFTGTTWLQATLEGLLFIVGIYGICKAFLFVLRHYIIYNIAKKLSSLIKKKELEKPKNENPSNREDELLRDEEREKEVEKIEVERIQKKHEKEIEQEFKILLPKAVGKWQRFVLGSRQNTIIAVAQRMQISKNMNFWQTLVQIQREQQGFSRERN